MAVPGTALPPGTSAGLNFKTQPRPTGSAPENAKTATIYGHVRDGKFSDAIRALSLELQNFPRSRAALSLLGHCYYAQQNFRMAAHCYEELCAFYPEVESYRLYYAQCLFKAGLYPEASKAASRIDSDTNAGAMNMLRAAIAFEEDDLPTARTLLDRMSPETTSLSQGATYSENLTVNKACVLFKEGKTKDALAAFESALVASGKWQADLAYNIALCRYTLEQYDTATQVVNDIISRGVREHPELTIGSANQGISVRSVGNTHVLKETALVEAFNLKAAIAYKSGQVEAASTHLSNMPPRLEEELDPVTLHNLALTEMSTNPSAGFSKLNFLLDNPPFPAEAFGNLLLLYVEHECLDLVADLMAANVQLTYRYLTPDVYGFLDAILMSETSPEESYKRLDILTNQHIETLRQKTKSLQDARLMQDNMAVKKALAEYDDTLEAYLPVLIGTARLYWNHQNYAAVEKILQQAGEFASDHDTWRLAMAHACFMQPGKYREAILHYEPIVRKCLEGNNGEKGSILDITAVILANLCVAYLMTGQNESAEEIMKAVESEENKLIAHTQPGETPPATFHLCIVNLVIGTLYCSKSNTEFGIGRIIRALDPPKSKLSTDTWYHVKRAFIHLAEGLAKGIVQISEACMSEVLACLDAADLYGKKIPSKISGPTSEEDIDSVSSSTVSQEARLLKTLFLKLKNAI